jgi:hypothetical protein
LCLNETVIKQASNKKPGRQKRPGFFIAVTRAGQRKNIKLQHEEKGEVDDEIINECICDQVYCCFIRQQSQSEQKEHAKRG